ncbi:hypothetical protein NGB36_11370 [Streptomyces sp. RB6PN25]|uniref:A-factor biosynthesis hotdog domain-containing protein n=1 Tax=Streptomyces humicola TaxID=2953240 RepID=A0ABT1PU32_9ACTN|nr:hypothetical protein [Streptomyces humicola]
MQGGTSVGAGSFAYAGRAASADHPVRGTPSAAAPVPAGLVHRARSENVLIGGFEQLGEDEYAAELLDPPPGHYLVSGTGPTRSLGELMEGLRQFATLLGHEAREVAADGQFIVGSFDVRLDRPLRRGRRTVLRCCGLPTARRRGAGVMRFTVHGGPIIGEAAITGHVVSRRAYEHLRRMRPVGAR